MNIAVIMSLTALKTDGIPASRAPKRKELRVSGRMSVGLILFLLSPGKSKAQYVVWIGLVSLRLLQNVGSHTSVQFWIELR